MEKEPLPYLNDNLERLEEELKEVETYAWIIRERIKEVKKAAEPERETFTQVCKTVIQLDLGLV